LLLGKNSRHKFAPQRKFEERFEPPNFEGATDLELLYYRAYCDVRAGLTVQKTHVSGK
jgi:hypothetical protein